MSPASQSCYSGRAAVPLLLTAARPSEAFDEGIRLLCRDGLTAAAYGGLSDALSSARNLVLPGIPSPIHLSPGWRGVSLLEMSQGIRNWMVSMSQGRTTRNTTVDELPFNTPLPRLAPYARCTCGVCRECRSNARWDRIFAKFEVKEWGEKKGFFRSPLDDL